jgi:hypothetical protein
MKSLVIRDDVWNKRVLQTPWKAHEFDIENTLRKLCRW